jgi:hypothetical protein
VVDARAMPVTYSVCALPEGHGLYVAYEIRVEYQGGGWWQIHHAGQCLNTIGQWDSLPADGGGEDGLWRFTHQHRRGPALGLALEHAHTITVGGLTATDALERA